MKQGLRVRLLSPPPEIGVFEKEKSVSFRLLVRVIESTFFLVGIILMFYFFKRYFKGDLLIELYMKIENIANFKTGRSAE